MFKTLPLYHVYLDNCSHFYCTIGHEAVVKEALPDWKPPRNRWQEASVSQLALDTEAEALQGPKAAWP